MGLLEMIAWGVWTLGKIRNTAKRLTTPTQPSLEPKEQLIESPTFIENTPLAPLPTTPLTGDTVPQPTTGEATSLVNINDWFLTEEEKEDKSNQIQQEEERKERDLDKKIDVGESKELWLKDTVSALFSLPWMLANRALDFFSDAQDRSQKGFDFFESDVYRDWYNKYKNWEMSLEDFYEYASGEEDFTEPNKLFAKSEPLTMQKFKERVAITEKEEEQAKKKYWWDREPSMQELNNERIKEEQKQNTIGKYVKDLHNTIEENNLKNKTLVSITVDRLLGEQFNRWWDIVSNIERNYQSALEHKTDSNEEDIKNITEMRNMAWKIFDKAMENQANVMKIAIENNQWGVIKDIPDYYKWKDIRGIYTDWFANILGSDFKYNFPVVNNSYLDILWEINSKLDYERVWEASDDWWGKKLWSRFQRGVEPVGSLVWEIGQHILGWFVDQHQDQDFSTIALLKNNDGKWMRLLRDFATSTQEYLPEIGGTILADTAISKWANSLWTVASKAPLIAKWGDRIQQITSKSKSAKIASWFLEKWAKGFIRDQFQDALFNVGNTEPYSDASYKISLWASFLTEIAPLFVKSWALKMAKNAVVNPKDILKGTPFDLLDFISKNKSTWETIAKTLGKESVGKMTFQDIVDYSKDFAKLEWYVEQGIKSLPENYQKQINQITKTQLYDWLTQFYNGDTLLANTVKKIIDNDKSNIADVVKYLSWVDGQVKIWPYVSTIAVDNGAVKEIRKSYDVALDTKVREGFTIDRGFSEAQMADLLNNWYKQADPPNRPEFFTYDENSKRYFLTEKGLDSFGVKIQDVDLETVAKVSDTSEAWSKNIKGNVFSKLNDGMVDEIVKTWTYDKLSQTIANFIC